MNQSFVMFLMAMYVFLPPLFYKEKSFIFKVLEGIIKDAGDVDMEDAS